ncbi:MAG: hypothetical protein AAGJ95_13945 [Cyanobacteria bacterium J06554_11]
MPIAGLTGQRNTPMQTNQLGKVWKGAKATGSGSSKRAGKDLINQEGIGLFRVEVPQPYDGVIMTAYGTMQPKQLRIFFPAHTTDEVFESWNDAFTAQGMKHRCNGTRIVREVFTQTSYRGGKPYQKRSARDCDRPCEKAEGEAKCKACEATGYLQFSIRELVLTAGLSQVMVETVSGVNDIVGLDKQLRAFEAKYGSLMQSPVPSPATYGRIPFVMSRARREVSRPIYDSQKKAFTGGYTKTTTHSILITEDPKWMNHWQNVTRRQQVMEMAQSGCAHLLIGEDLELLHEMQAISLPMAAPSVSQQPQLSSTPDLKPALKPATAEVDTLAIADQNAIEGSENDYVQALLNREPKDRIKAVNGFLVLSREDMTDCWPLDDDGNPFSSDDPNQADEIILAMFQKYGRKKNLQEGVAAKIIDRLTQDVPLVDEDLARMFIQEVPRMIAPESLPAPEVIGGVSID